MTHSTHLDTRETPPEMADGPLREELAVERQECRTATCPDCTGSISPGDCPACDGEGYMDRAGLKKCGHCSNTGECPTCSGAGIVPWRVAAELVSELSCDDDGLAAEHEAAVAAEPDLSPEFDDPFALGVRGAAAAFDRLKEGER